MSSMDAKRMLIEGPEPIPVVDADVSAMRRNRNACLLVALLLGALFVSHVIWDTFLDTAAVCMMILAMVAVVVGWLFQLLLDDLREDHEPIGEGAYIEVAQWIEADEQVALYCGKLAKIGRELTHFEYRQLKEWIEGKDARAAKEAVLHSAVV